MTHIDPLPDTSLLAGLDHNPAFIETALSRGTFAECAVCRRVLAVAITRELAEMEMLTTRTGRKVGNEFRCADHDHISKAKAGAHR